MSTAAASLPGRDRFDAVRLPPRELLGVALQGLRTRRLRAALSALGIAIGIGAMVAVVGVSASSQANLLATIDKLGTNLLTVTPGQNFEGNNEVLPDTSVPMIEHMQNVDGDAAVYQVSGATVLRTPFVPSQETGGIGVDAAGDNLPQVVGTSMASGPLPRRRRRPIPGGRARRSGREHPRDHPGRRAPRGVSRQYLVHRDRDPEAGAARLVDRHDRVHLAAGGRADVPDAAEPVRDLRARERQRRRAGLEPARADGRPPGRQRRRREPPVGRARGARRGQGPVHDATARARRGGAARRRDRDREHHGDLGARAPRRDRPAPRAGCHPPAHLHPVPRRVGGARGAGRPRRAGPRRRRDRGVRGGAEGAVRRAAVRARRLARLPAS